jgi:cyclopropane fatty-acyl-phospholipid synthase-like methyltransferase
MRNLRLGVVACTLVFLLTTMLHAQDGHRPGHGHSHSFSDPKKWSATFDDPERDKWQMPDRIIAALALRPTDLVADIGAGTGYLAVRIARQLGSGTVYAVDDEPKMEEQLAERAKAAGEGNHRAIARTETSDNLPEKVDVVVMLNV